MLTKFWCLFIQLATNITLNSITSHLATTLIGVICYWFTPIQVEYRFPLASGAASRPDECCTKIAKQAFWCMMDCIADACDKSFSWCTTNAKSHLRTSCNRQCRLRTIIITVLFNIVVPAIIHGWLNIDMHLTVNKATISPDEHQQWANLFEEADDKFRISGSDQ